MASIPRDKSKGQTGLATRLVPGPPGREKAGRAKRAHSGVSRRHRNAPALMKQGLNSG